MMKDITRNAITVRLIRLPGHHLQFHGYLSEFINFYILDGKDILSTILQKFHEDIFNSF